MHIGEAIKDARRLAGLTQEQLAERIGVHRKTVSRLETGSISPTPYAVRLEQVLGIPLTNRQPVPPRPADVSQMSNHELTAELMRIAAELARRLPPDGATSSLSPQPSAGYREGAPGWTTTRAADIQDESDGDDPDESEPSASNVS